MRRKRLSLIASPDVRCSQSTKMYTLVKGMPNQLDANWPTSTWPQRFGFSSTDVNRRLLGERFTQDGQHWTSRDVAAFVRWMDRHCVVLDRTTIMYRGTPNEVPYFSNAPSLTFSSTSRVRAIAAEFARKKGFVHVLRCFPGCRVFDMEAASPAPREREVLLLPGSTFVRRRRRGQTIHWDVRV